MQAPHLRLGQAQLAGEAVRARDPLGGALDPLVARGLEEVGVEQLAHHGLNVAVGLEEHALQPPHGVGVARLLHAPGRDARLVGDEEVVEVPPDEAPGRGLLHDDVDDVLAVEAPGVAQEGLLRVVVQLFAVDEARGVAAVRVERQRLLEGPAGEGVGRRLDVVFGVVAHAHREQLEQLAPVVFVGPVAEVLAVVQPVDHRRVARELEQQVAHVAQPAAPEHLDLVGHRGTVLRLEVGRGEDVVPEERHLLAQRVAAVDHPVDPARAPRPGRVRVGQRGEVAEDEIVVRLRLGGGLDQLLDQLLVGPLGQLVELLGRHAHAGAAHQVRCQAASFVGCHCSVSPSRRRRLRLLQLLRLTRIYDIGGANCRGARKRARRAGCDRPGARLYWRRGCPLRARRAAREA